MLGVGRQVADATQSRRDLKVRHLAAAEYLEGLVVENEDLSIVVAQHLLDAVDASSPGDDDGDEDQGDRHPHQHPGPGAAREHGPHPHARAPVRTLCRVPHARPRLIGSRSRCRVAPSA